MKYNIYLCGPTVYNHVHIGNIRPILSMDLILKAFKILGKDFYFVHNITDIDDKIIARAIQENVSEKEISSFYANEYLRLLKKLNIDTISKIEYVTENLGAIENFVKALLLSKNAYKGEGSNVWFDVLKNKDIYGQVSHQKIDNMVFEDNNQNKRFMADFALWKSTDIGIKYKTEFGLGRPGWHTECCALIYKNFGSQGVDIHGGGMDLTFPHHENENVQFQVITRNPIAKKWLRIGMININGEKMSKSLNNFILAKDFLDKYHPDVLKFIILLNSYTGIINIDENLIHNINKIMNRIKKIYFSVQLYLFNNQGQKLTAYYEETYKKAMTNLSETQFNHFMTIVHELIKQSAKDIVSAKTLIKIFDDLKFGFSQIDYPKYIKIYDQWQQLLSKKEFIKADELRSILIEEGLI